ncbi:MAG: hypothetical protein GY702_13760 [Desulfobulbaceae bacterium]|nr:hypothetical protein [Desulfobulbaceae bacterium]
MKFTFGTKVKANPLLACIIGWVLFPCMYLLIGLFTTLGLAVQTAFILSLPLGILGFIFWLLSLNNSTKEIWSKKHTLSNWLALIGASIPLLFLTFGMYIAVFKGGV